MHQAGFRSLNSVFASLLNNTNEWYVNIDGAFSGQVNGGAFSDLHELDCGAPQGACLGPLLFLIHVNGLSLALNKCNITIYAIVLAICMHQKTLKSLMLH